jgi:hypothetical protein
LFKARARSNLVELTPELFNQNLRIDPILKPLHRETFVFSKLIKLSVRLEMRVWVRALLLPVVPSHHLFAILRAHFNE